MRDASTTPARGLVILTLVLWVAACSGGSPAGSVGSSGGGTAAGSGSGTSGAGAAPAPGGSPATQGGSAGEGTATGSITSSGGYDAAWTWQPGNAVDVGTGGTTLNSDKGTFGNIAVLDDGSITFTSGAPELKSGSYKGTGAQVHMQDASGTQLPCGYTLDNDVTGSDGVVIHLKGTIDVHGTVWGCP